VEPNRESIEDWMRRYGYEEKEAEAAYHLRQAQDRIIEMYRAQVEADAEARIGGWQRIYGRTRTSMPCTACWP
jgi:hypothetical protein